MISKSLLLVVLSVIIPALVQAQRSSRSADSLYLVAREAMARNDNKEALKLFENIRKKYPNTNVAGNAAYYQAFLLYRKEDVRSLRAAHAILSSNSQNPHYSYNQHGNDSRTLLVRVCGALARHGDKRCSADLINTAQELECEDDAESTLRVAALSAVQNMDAGNATPILKKVLSKPEKCPRLRRQAMYIALRQRSPDLVETMYDIVRKDPDKQMRMQAVSYLLDIQTRETAKKLIELARREKDTDVRNAIVHGLSRSRDPAVTSALIDLLNK